MASAPRTSPSLLDQTLSQLRELAKRLGVRTYTKLAKAELLEVLAQAETLPAAPSSPAATATPQAPITTQMSFLPRNPQWA